MALGPGSFQLELHPHSANLFPKMIYEVSHPAFETYVNAAVIKKGSKVPTALIINVL